MRWYKNNNVLKTERLMIFKLMACFLYSLDQRDVIIMSMRQYKYHRLSWWQITKALGYILTDIAKQVRGGLGWSHSLSATRFQNWHSSSWFEAVNGVDYHYKGKSWRRFIVPIRFSSCAAQWWAKVGCCVLSVDLSSPTGRIILLALNCVRNRRLSPSLNDMTRRDLSGLTALLSSYLLVSHSNVDLISKVRLISPENLLASSSGSRGEYSVSFRATRRWTNTII